MSVQEVTRWQHNRIYPQPVSLCEYKNDLNCHLQLSIYITILKYNASCICYGCEIDCFKFVSLMYETGDFKTYGL